MGMYEELTAIPFKNAFCLSICKMYFPKAIQAQIN